MSKDVEQKNIINIPDTDFSNDNYNIITDTITEYTELIVDVHLQEGILKEIPFVKTIYGAYKIGKNVHEINIIKKITNFLNSLKNLTSEEKEAVLQQFNKTNKKDLGDKICLILEKTDDFNKATLLGKSLKLLKQEDVNLDFYFRLCHLINNSFYNDLLYLDKFTDETTILTSSNRFIPEEIIENLFSYGFLTNCGFDGGDLGDEYNQGTRYALNKYGIKLKALLNE